ncbi:MULTISPECIES: capsular polysaccharide biosynthesis protein CapF [Bacteroides]|uniref:capsular polysaccharide biosynthesis protein CapF n=1 Tax=Bacteroides TaxID=816 RepID=UPI00095A02C0|nr:capsular polysaccharide biosynthesis protein CapF [Bacteroides nordii]OKZ08584.1 MAG: capsular biosynthesis protein [Bacteroides sp. 41_26]
MKILVTGAKGFIGRNLVSQLHNIQLGKVENASLSVGLTIFEYDVDSDPVELELYCKDADFVFNLAGVNRPKDPTEFMQGNFGFTSVLLDTLKKYHNTCPVMLSSSIQAILDNPYGESKRAGEELLFDYSRETGANVLIYRFPNVFGKWCRPNYNSVIATFCHNIAHDLPIQVNDPNVLLSLVYVDDVVDELIAALTGNAHCEGDYYIVPTIHTVTLGKVVELLHSFKESRKTLDVPNVGDPFTKKLYSTYLSYLPQNQFCYPLKMNVDNRGSFTEIIRTSDRGQFSVNISKPNITKGNHWHHTKNEKFVVVSGRGVVRFRDMNDPTSKVIEYLVSGENIEVIDIPTGYTHNIENLGDTDMVTFMWCNECFDSTHPDTFFEEV